ncbi:DNA repair protein RecO [Thalassotalea agarivorans]|uniref:DNA repair protein RecO n=1 Tax=Thalassotalea agarivorans TaxID=349064 RepID=A0A1I0FX68_THASX|nr:DNA repair protein RecO [Thalassotalea agarivorans]SET62837.1 DNA replication and repair protein RecO [Thalassotalea agarivorans]
MAVLAPQLAYVLHSRPYKENQYLLTLLTANDGKVGAVISIGTSKTSAYKKALIQPFTQINVTLKGGHGLQRVTHIEGQVSSKLLRGNFLYSGFYINELLTKLMPEFVPCELLFERYVTAIENLDQQAPLEPNLRQFELLLFAELGQGLDFTFALSNPELNYSFDLEKGFRASESGKEHLIIPGYILAEIAQQTVLSAQALNALKNINRTVINDLLHGKPLNSRKLFSQARS